MKSKNLQIKPRQGFLKNIGRPGLLIMASVLLVLIFSACSVKSDIVFTEKQNNKSVSMKSGDKLNVMLKSNQTTGYGWKLSKKTDTKIILLESSAYETSSKDKNIAGAGGFETFTFRAESPGQTKLILEYVRSWEEEVEPVNTYMLNVEVN